MFLCSFLFVLRFLYIVGGFTGFFNLPVNRRGNKFGVNTCYCIGYVGKRGIWFFRGSYLTLAVFR